MFLRGIEARGRHSVFEVERREGQRFIVDVDWWLDTSRSVATEDLGDTVTSRGTKLSLFYATPASQPPKALKTTTAFLCAHRTIVLLVPAGDHGVGSAFAPRNGGSGCGARGKQLFVSGCRRQAAPVRYGEQAV